MIKLISANHRYLVKSKLFWIEVIVCAVISVWIMVANYSPKIQASEYPIFLENSFFNFSQIICILFACVISMITGTEYSDGTIRNKLIVGHKRYEIYFAMLISNVVASVLVMAVHCIVSYAVGYFLFGGFHISAVQIIIALVCNLLANLAFVTLFSAIAMNCSNKALTAILSILLSLGVIIAANIAGNRLDEPEMVYDGVIITENGFQYGDLVENPNYVTGFARSICEFIFNVLPSGQLIQIKSLDLADWQYWCASSVLLFVVITIIGYVFFEKKDIT